MLTLCHDTTHTDLSMRTCLPSARWHVTVRMNTRPTMICCKQQTWVTVRLSPLSQATLASNTQRHKQLSYCDSHQIYSGKSVLTFSSACFIVIEVLSKKKGLNFLSKFDILGTRRCPVLSWFSTPVVRQLGTPVGVSSWRSLKFHRFLWRWN